MATAPAIRKRPPRPLRSRLALLVFVSAVPVLLFAVIMATLFERQHRAVIEANLRETAGALAIAVDHELIASISALRVLATSELLERDRLGLFYEQARRALRAHDGWATIAVCDHTGQQVVNLSLPIGSPLPFSGNVPVIRAVLDTHRPAISDLHKGPVSGGPILGVGVPVMRGERLEYALLAGLDVRMLTRLLSDTKLPRDWIATIIDRNGIIVARTQNIDTLLGTPATATFVRRSRAEEEGSFRDVTRDGIPVYGAFSRSRLSGWTVGLGVPAVDVEGPGRKALAAIIGGGLLFLVVSGGLALVSGRQIIDAIAALSAAARAVGHGETPAWTDTTGILEIDHAGREMSAAARGRSLAQIDHRRAEAALEESEERLQMLVARALDAVITIDGEGRVTSWNPQAVQLFGWSREEILGRRLSETIVPEALRESHERGLARFRTTGRGMVLDQRLEMTALHRDGREFPVEVSIAALRMGGAVSFGAFIRDISDRRRQEAERLRQSEEPYRMLVDGIRDYAIFRLDPDGRVASWNTGAQQISGYRAEEIVGRSAAAFYPPESDGAAQLARQLAEARDAGRFESESWQVKKDGTRYLAHMVTTPLHDAEGEVRGYSKITQDVTERHLAQEALEEKTRALESAQETLIRKERLAVVGELAGGVSHELRNPLGVIANSIYYLRMVVPDAPKVEKHLGILEREVRTATAIVTELLDFSRTRPPTPTLVDLNALVVEQLERASVPAGVTVKRDLAPDLPGVPVDHAQIGLVVGNLISNAVQAMPDGGTLTLASAHSNGAAAVAVVDTGTGIAADVLNRIFEPLFTTKNRGIGLGLSIARNLTEANGGTIAVESGPGQGTRFTLRFRIPAPKATPPRPGENGR